SFTIAWRACTGYVDSDKTAIREISGTASLKSSRRLALKSALIGVNPVALLPGRDRLATTPSPTGSLANAKTIGICDVARCTANAALDEGATMTSTFNLTSSDARRGSSSELPSAYRRSTG